MSNENNKNIDANKLIDIYFHMAKSYPDINYLIYRLSQGKCKKFAICKICGKCTFFDRKNLFKKDYKDILKPKQFGILTLRISKLLSVAAIAEITGYSKIRIKQIEIRGIINMLNTYLNTNFSYYDLRETLKMYHLIMNKKISERKNNEHVITYRGL